MPLTKQQIAIKCHYEGRRKSNYRPRDKMVLDGKVKLTPERLRVLYYVAFADDLRWKLERDWSNGWRGGLVYVPHVAGVRKTTIVTYLRRMKLVTFSHDGWRPALGDATRLPAPIMMITGRGIDALLETVGGL